MSWWFSKKKSSPSTPPETTAANIPNSEGDDFIFVERKSSLKPNLDDDSESRPASNPLYPPLLPYSLGQPSPGISPSRENTLNRQDSVTAGPHMLQGLPFKLAPALDSGDSVHIRQYTEFTNDVLFQISQINIETLQHDFSVEQSVLQELSTTDGD